MKPGRRLAGWQNWFGAVLVQGLVASVWIVGMARTLQPVPPEIRVRWTRWALVFPVLVPTVQVVLPDLVFGRWLPVASALTALREAPASLQLAVGLLLTLTTVLFLAQEVLPTLWGRRSWARHVHQEDPRLERVGQQVQAAFRDAGLSARTAPVRVLCMDVQEPAALLWGIFRPRVLVARGLMAEVDDEMLAGVIAHELAHLVRGGNRTMTGLWLVRALQAPSPAALVTFRTLAEIEELACDALAARVLRRPAALASALLKTRRPHARDARGLTQVRQRGEIAFVRQRVRRLLDTELGAAPSAWAGYGAGLLLILVLWGIG